MYCDTTLSVETMKIPHRKRVTKSRKLRRLQMMAKVIGDIQAKELCKPKTMAEVIADQQEEIRVMVKECIDIVRNYKTIPETLDTDLSDDISVITKSFKKLKVKKKNLRISFAEKIEEVRIYERDVQVVDDFRTMACEMSEM